MAKEDDISTIADMPRWRRTRWWSPRWLWWFIAESPKPPSLYLRGEAAPDQDAFRVQFQRWLDREP